MKSIRVAVIGAGALGEHHARIYSKLPEATLVAVVDTRLERAQRLARQYGGLACTDYQEVLDQVQAVSLAVPTRQHAGLGVEFLKRGIHLLVEKPIAHDLESADRLIKESRRSGAVLHVGHSERFNPALTAVRAYLTKPRFFEAHRLGVFVPRSLDIDVVLDLMIHDVDLVVHLLGESVREIRAVGIPVLTSQVDIANARLEFESGCVANLTASRVSREKIRKLRFFQFRDYVSIDFHQQDVEMYSLVEKGAERKITERALVVEREEPLKLEIQAFLDAIVRERSPMTPECSGEEAKRALALVLDIKQAIDH